MESVPETDEDKIRKREEEYLEKLHKEECEAIDQYDKYVLALSSGAFAVSFAFLKDIIKVDVVRHKWLLIVAWAGWGLALGGSLIAFYISHIAMRRAQIKFRSGVRQAHAVVGSFGRAIEWLNPISGICFGFGLISMMIFVTVNLATSKATETGSAATTNAPPNAKSAAIPITQGQGTNTPAKHSPPISNPVSVTASNKLNQTNTP